MRTWILDTDGSGARIFQRSSATGKAVLYQVLSALYPRLRHARPGGRSQSPTAFLRRVAREMDLACGAGTESQLVIYGDEPVLSRLLPLLGADTKERLVGAFSRQSVSYPPATR